MKITSKTVIVDITKMTDRAEEIFGKLGIGCLSCPTAQTENLEHAALVHALDLDELVATLNKEVFGE